ncbi:4155_t:CDS:2 [Funneliformis mosseae]|uniref:4155_t:CDS:1 n=1 Tax=Funneliformis mosseae TaxID=27381 RepID=A0A9N9AHL4_FUNMO|nr:4155_t:CDS:2 [Funneliformis mosseae]
MDEFAAFTNDSVAFVENSSGSVAFAEGSISFAKDSNTIFAEGSVAFEDDSDTRGSVVLIRESDTSRKEIENEIQINVSDTFSSWDERIELDNDGIVQHHIFECSFSSKPISNQSSSEIRVNNIIGQHNYFMIPDTYLYASKSLLYRAKIVLKEVIDIAKDNDQHNYSNGFLKDQLDRPQTSIFFLLERIQLSDIIEIWELTGLTKSYKHYVILLIDSDHLYMCLTIINHELLKALDIFIADVKQRIQRKEKYTYRFGKIKKALNLTLDLGCKTEFINMINVLENAHYSTKISALNSPDPNLQSSSRISLHTYDVSNHR